MDAALVALVEAVLRAQVERSGQVYATGILDIVDDGYGFMRRRGVMPSPDDVYVSSAQVRRSGLRPGDRYLCPSSPAWGHGLWHGTIAPLTLGVHTASYSGRFDARLLWSALEDLRINTFAAAPTVFRLLRQSGHRADFDVRLEKISFTGEPMDAETARWVTEAFGVPAVSMYGSTEVGVILASFPGLPGYEPRPGALGSAAPGWEVSIVDDAGRELPPGAVGEIAVRRKGEWFPVKDRGRRDADGYFFHGGRSDDVIISAGWTMSALEIEQTLLAHPAVAEAAVIAVPDALRGHVPKAFIVARAGRAARVEDLQEWVKTRLSQHEYPRHVAFVDALPRTPAGKVNRKALRDRAGEDPVTLPSPPRAGERE